MAKTRVIGAVCLCCMLATLLASGEAISRQKPYDTAISTVRGKIWQAINSGKCGSATAAIMVDGDVLYAEGFGMANREKSIPVDTATLFNIGSVSKVYVATAIMLLVDDGKVALDNPVTDYLPEFRMADERYKTITVRMLLNHTSGIPGTEYLNSFGFQYANQVRKETIATLARAHLKHAPGAMAVYCNDGFTLAEMIVERVSGGRYTDFLEKRIFKPLGLKNTGRSVGELKGKPVALYYDAQTGKMHPPEALSVLGAGGLSSTAAELCRFFADAFSAENKLLKKASLAEMKKTQLSAFRGKLRNPAISFGLGWDFTGLPRYDAAGIQVLGKSGGTGNYSSMVFTVPDKRITVAVIASGAESGAMEIALDVLDAVLVEKKLISKEEKSLLIPRSAQKFPPGDASFSGYYASAKFGQVVFDADKNNVSLYHFKEREKAPAMTLVYNNGYYYDATGNRYYFVSTGDESYFVAYLAMAGIDVIAMQKVKPLEKPHSLKINMDDKVWLRRNASPLDAITLVDSHFTKSLLYKDLPGYVVFGGVKRIVSPVFAGMPFDAIRDQTELTLIEKNGATWASVSDMVYSPAESAVALKAGENSVRIGDEGYNEWLLAEEGMVLSFTKPKLGRIIIFSSDDTATYDSALDAGDAYAAKGSYIEFAGFADDVFTVKAKPAAEEKTN